MGTYKNGAKKRGAFLQNLPVTIQRKNSQDLLSQFLQDTKVPMPEGLKQHVNKIHLQARPTTTNSTRAGNKIIEHITKTSAFIAVKDKRTL